MSEQGREFKKFMSNKGYAVSYVGDGQYEFSSTQLNWEIWQAATAEANKRIDALESEVAEWQGQALGNGLAYANLFKEFVELQANNHDLREALKLTLGVITGETLSKSFLTKALEKSKLALSATPAESLQEKYNKALEKTANIAIETLRPDLGIAVAEQLRSQKEVK